MASKWAPSSESRGFAGEREHLLHHLDLETGVNAGGGGGSGILSDTDAPTSAQGSDGDFFVQTVDGVAAALFGPKASGVWPSGAPIGPSVSDSLPHWEAVHGYLLTGATILPTVLNGHYFSIDSALGGTSGASEPTWNTGGETTDSADLSWSPAALLTTSGAWAAHTAATGDTNVIADGSVWNTEGTSGNSGATQPVWTTAPNLGDTISDGALTWTRLHPFAGPWTAHTFYGVTSAPDPATSSYVRPVAGAAGFAFYPVTPSVLTTVPSGSVEPDWSTPSTVQFATNFYYDGNVVWYDAGTFGPDLLVMHGSVDPSAGSGIPATIGRLYTRDDTGTVWAKTSAPDTGWRQLAFVP